MTLTQKWCVLCREKLLDDGPMGWVHPDGSSFGPDGHTVTPVDQAVADRTWKAVGVS